MVFLYEHALPYVVEASNDHVLNGRALGEFDVIIFSFGIHIRGVLCVCVFIDVFCRLTSSIPTLT